MREHLMLERSTLGPLYRDRVAPPASPDWLSGVLACAALETAHSRPAEELLNPLRADRGTRGSRRANLDHHQSGVNI